MIIYVPQDLAEIYSHSAEKVLDALAPLTNDVKGNVAFVPMEVAYGNQD